MSVTRSANTIAPTLASTSGTGKFKRLDSIKRPRQRNRTDIRPSTNNVAQNPTATSSAPPSPSLLVATNDTSPSSLQQVPVNRSAVCPEPSCRSTALEESENQLVCTNCGAIISESTIVSDVTFQENAIGAAQVQGGFVGEDQRHARVTDPTLQRHGGGKSSREQAESHAKHEIQNISRRLGLPESVEMAAFRMYKLALNESFTQGRRVEVTAAACLYIACRREQHNSPILLVDFAEIVRVSVYKLGQIFKELVQEHFPGWFPHEQLQHLEVENLIMKYAKRLEFGRETEKVAEDAVRILKRMKRDWMVTGRQPAGLCGACIILAARMNNFRRTVREVVYIVKVADMTVSKRLEEFTRTPSGTLTVDQFREYAPRLKMQFDPPAIRDRELRKRRTREESGLNRSGSQIASSSSTSSSPPHRDADGFVVPPRPSETGGSYAAARTMAASEETSASPVAGSSPGLSKKRKRRGRPPLPQPLKVTSADLAEESQLEDEIKSYLSLPVATTDFWTASDRVVSVENANETAKELAAIHRPETRVPDAQDIDPDEFDDDEEVRNCVLSPEEQEIKEAIWTTLNEDWLRAQQARELKRALDEAQGVKTQPVRRRAKRRKTAAKSGMDGNGDKNGDGEISRASTPAEGVRGMLRRFGVGRGYSNRVNYDMLARVYNTATRDEREGSTSTNSEGASAANGGGNVAGEDASNVAPFGSQGNSSGLQAQSPQRASAGKAGVGDSLEAGDSDGDGDGDVWGHPIDIEDDDDDDNQFEGEEENEDDVIDAVTGPMGMDVGDGLGGHLGGFEGEEA